MGPQIWLSSFLTVIQIQYIQAYSSGAGFSACNNMIPGHGGSTQTSEVPFTLVPQNIQVQAGQTIGQSCH